MESKYDEIDCESDIGIGKRIGSNWEEIAIKNIDIGEQIGGGGFAIVYQGVWKKKKVALKTLFDPRVDEELKDEFMNELFIMSQLDHPHIVTLYGACVRPPSFAMVMELCEESLFSLLHVERQQLSEKTVLRLMCEVASALEYLHSQTPSIIHRDIKSQNILITDDLHVKICDFGLVGSKVTTAGTPAYMAPELLENGLFSRKVDVYAFAMLMWECFTESVPFNSWGVGEIREFVLDDKRLRVPYDGCSKQCGKLIEKCWEQDPQKRPEFKNIRIALDRLHTSIREVSYTDEVQKFSDGDSFDQLTASVMKKK